MPPPIALSIWLVCLVLLFLFDPAKDSHVSGAIWIPLVWMFILGSRLPSQWFGYIQADQAMDGNPLDRAILSVLMLIGLVVLTRRSFRWGEFFARNVCLTAFLAFALISVIWSDYSLIALKRWFRDFGNYLMVLVVLTDPRPVAAVRVLFRRASYLLIPLSIVLVKYFPAYSRHYDAWSGTPMESGAATSKNMLGVMCLISALFFFWDTVERWSQRKDRRTKRAILVNLALFGMCVWLLHMAHSATSSTCLIIGCAIILFVRSKGFARRQRTRKWWVPVGIVVYLILSLGLNINERIAPLLGRNPTLTDRTVIWGAIFKMHVNPLLGSGYESFWMGSRLDQFAALSGLVGINEAHNGYIEVYINLGLIGLFLLTLFMFDSYRNIFKKPPSYASFTSFSVAVWTTILFYSITEAGFRSGWMWFSLLCVGIAVPSVRYVEAFQPDVSVHDIEEPMSGVGTATESLGADGNITARA